MTWDSDMKKLHAEANAVESGAEQCPSKSNPEQCLRVAGHVGCHFAYVLKVDGSPSTMTMRWSDKGKRLGAAYPKRAAAPAPGKGGGSDG